MYRSPRPSHIRPKVSNMPRQQSEAAACLDVYKLVVEKKRLQAELAKLDQRRDLILSRIQQLDSQIQLQEQTIDQMRLNNPAIEPQPLTKPANPAPARPASESTSSDEFDTLTLEY